jgi:protocatechuate 3,4-dioxygenase beta subunit
VRLLTLLLCGMLACLAFASQGASQASAQGPEEILATIQGQVLLAPDDQPLRKVAVELSSGNEQSGENYSARTDADGRFKLDGVKPGPYRVQVFREGFFREYRNDRHSELVVQPGESNPELVFHLRRSAVIVGTIVDADGDPMSGVSVEVVMGGRLRPGETGSSFSTSSTNDLGEFRISGLLPTRYIVLAKPPREYAESTEEKKAKRIYVTTYYPNVSIPGQAVPVELHAGEELAIHFGLLMTKAYRVRGTVTGLPAGSAAAKIMLTPKDNEQVRVDEESQEMNPDGTFEFQHVLPGQFVARVIAAVNTPGGPPSKTHIVKLGPPIEIIEEDLEAVHLQPEPVGQIHGKFRMDNGQTIDWTQLAATLIPVAGEKLQPITDLTTSSDIDLSGADGFAWLKKDGSFEIKDVAAGTFRMGVAKVAIRTNALHDYFVKSVTVGGHDVSDSGFFAGPDTNVDVVFSGNAATIDGRVVDEDGQGVPQASIVAVPSPDRRMRGELYGYGRTDSKGNFLLRGVNPGEYTILAFRDVYADVADPAVMKEYEGKGENLTLDEGARKSVTLKIIRGKS